MAESSSEEHNKSDVLITSSSNSEDQAGRSIASTVENTSLKEEQKRPRSIIKTIRSSISILGHLFYRTSNEDFEKKLEHLSKEEAAAHTRLKRRSQAWRKLARGLVIYSIVIELLILGAAVVTTRAPELTWQMRSLRVLPVFGFPALASLIYSTCASYYRMCERKDQKMLDRLRNERQAKINELKERTNYYLTQQLIHKYDSDPAAKEAAARVLAAKLGADAGLSLAFEAPKIEEATRQGVHQSAEPLETTGLRKRVKQHSANGSHAPPTQQMSSNEGMQHGGRMDMGAQDTEMDQFAWKPSNGGWMARLAAMLVGEDPTQCYALICHKCHMHNGLARKEDFQYITYFCPHCHSLNGSRQLGETGECSSSHANSPTSGNSSSPPQLVGNISLPDALLTDTVMKSNHDNSSSSANSSMS